MTMQEQLKKFMHAEGLSPCASLILPLARTIPERLQNTVHLKALCKQALQQLAHDTSPRAQKIAQRIKDLPESLDLNAFSSEGIAILIGAHEEKIVPLYTSCTAQTRVGTVFSLSAIIQAHHNNPPFWVLTVGKEHAHLFTYENQRLHEIVTPLKDDTGKPLQGFPLDALPPEDKFKQAAGKGDRDARYRDAEVTKFFQLVDQELQKILTTREKMPIILCGTPEYLTGFITTSHHKGTIALQVPHDYNAHAGTIEKLHKDVQAALDTYNKEQEQKLLKAFEESINQRRQACSLTHVWEMASTGRVQTLLLEPNLLEIGRINPDNPANLQVYDRKTDDTLDLISDILIHETLRHDGNVHIVRPGSLTFCKGYGAILRY